MLFKSMTAWTAAACGAVALSLGACATGMPGMGGHMGGMPEGQPGIPYSGARPVAENQAVLDALKTLGLRPYHTLSPAEARNQPTFATGVMEVMRQQGRPLTPPPGVAVRDIQVQGGAGMIRAKVYTPEMGSGPRPVIVYYHGGGWVIASPETYDASARALARETGAIVVSVDYRLAPEHKFPAQHDDALAAYRWVAQNAGSIGGDPMRLALAGESAGGNLAVATAIAARDAGLTAPKAILSVYPIAQADMNTPSYQANANAMPLNRAAMAWFAHHAGRSPADLMDPRISLVNASLRGLPPVTIVQAEIDPLLNDGDMLADKLRAAGVTVNEREWRGVTHEFFGADAVIPQAGEAQRWAGGLLKTALMR
jgi:acetyl esterase